MVSDGRRLRGIGGGGKKPEPGGPGCLGDVQLAGEAAESGVTQSSVGQSGAAEAPEVSVGVKWRFTRSANRSFWGERETRKPRAHEFPGPRFAPVSDQGQVLHILPA